MIDTFSGSFVPRDQAEAAEDQKQPTRVSAGSQERLLLSPSRIPGIIRRRCHPYQRGLSFTFDLWSDSSFRCDAGLVHSKQALPFLKAAYNLTVTMTTAVFLNFREMLLRGNECFQRPV